MGITIRPFVVAALLILLVSCGTPNQPAVLPSTTATIESSTVSAPSAEPTAFQSQPELKGTITIDGSSTVFPITEAASRAFASQAPNVQIQLGVSGTSGGFKKFCTGETVISDASRPIKQSEEASCAEHNIDYIELPIAYDGISVVVNQKNTWLACITTDELKQLWEPTAEGTILRWKQIRADWPDEPIHLYGPGADSGTYDYFTSALVGEEGVSRQDYTGSEDDYLIGQDVAADPTGLGFFGYAYSQEFSKQLNVVAINNGHSCTQPTSETIANSTYQPLSRPIFLYIRRDALERPEVSAFLEFYLDQAAKLVAEAKYVPLSERAYTIVRERFQRRETGSVFSGGSQIGVSIEELLTLERH